MFDVHKTKADELCRRLDAAVALIAAELKLPKADAETLHQTAILLHSIRGMLANRRNPSTFDYDNGLLLLLWNRCSINHAPESARPHIDALVQIATARETTA